MVAIWRQWLTWWCMPPRVAFDALPRHEKHAFNMVVRVADVYDGDTFTVVALIDGAWQRRRCRCAGYDSPELRSRDPIEKKRAVLAREHLKEMLPKTAFVLRVQGHDKYGRWLVEVPCRALADNMIAAGHAVAYNGGTKPTFAQNTSQE